MGWFTDWLHADNGVTLRWVTIFVAPLLVAGGVAGTVLLTKKDQGCKYDNASRDNSVELPVRLTFLGAAVAGIAQFKIFSDNTQVAPDLGVLLVANLVFTGLAASNGLMEGFPGAKDETSERLRTMVVLWASIGSLLSAYVVIWRAPADLVPAWVTVLFFLMVLAAVVMVSFYERSRLQARAVPGVAQTGTTQES